LDGRFWADEPERSAEGDNQKTRHTDSLAESFDVASQDPKKHVVFCLPFLMAAKPPDGDDEDNDARVIAIQEMMQHKICQSALMELISVRKQWWGICCEHLKSGTVPVHGLIGLPSNCKQRFREEEEVHLIEFFTEIKEFTEPSATRFVLEKTGEMSSRNDDTELEYLPPSWLRLKLYQRYAHLPGWNATANNIGAVKLIPWADEPQLHLCSWPTFFYYWKTYYPK
jgi:hypothetical protein